MVIYKFFVTPMPVRNMLYDAIQYSDQVHEICKTHKKNNDKPDTSGEFLSQFYKGDKLIPVITLVIYLGPDEWDAPMSVHEMLDVKDPRILKYVQDYTSTSSLLLINFIFEPVT